MSNTEAESAIAQMPKSERDRMSDRTSWVTKVVPRIAAEFPSMIMLDLSTRRPSGWVSGLGISHELLPCTNLQPLGGR
ncbi:hypothetical protein GCM10011575_46970 [Microlunatus endophyticus]|uniref:Uncharacterized protein n=1 Tax=Microlunatus endophyticus TaxID=1716077 RepID=A0A917SJH9_9ACTN|nr:hypothetical protein GCM10011575_46970 [Microlunatus endophyticus]